MSSLNYKIMPTRLTEKGATLNFVSRVKRGKYNSLAKLYETLRGSVNKVSHLFSCHLITYPHISVMIECGDIELLNANSEKLREIVEAKLWECMGS